MGQALRYPAPVFSVTSLQYLSMRAPCRYIASPFAADHHRLNVIDQLSPPEPRSTKPTPRDCNFNGVTPGTKGDISD
jgi:hypothetical protein